MRFLLILNTTTQTHRSVHQDAQDIAEPEARHHGYEKHVDSEDVHMTYEHRRIQTIAHRQPETNVDQ